MKHTFSTEILQENQLRRAGALLRSGEVVAFPTETVYGLGARIFSPLAIEKIFQAKGRPADNPLIAHISDLSQVELIASDIPEDFYTLAAAFFPGPLTVVLRKSERVPSIVSGGLDTIAFRMPSHPLARALIKEVCEPIVAPSANLSGTPSSTHFEHVLEDFEGRIAAIIQSAPSEIGIESTVISLLGDVPQILRPGHITKQELEAILQKKVGYARYSKDVSAAVFSPGMKYRHYAPKARVRLFFSKEEIIGYVTDSHKDKRLVLSCYSNELIEGCGHAFLTPKTLYAALRKADADGYHEVLVLCDAVILQNEALMNRLSKAAELS